MLVYVLNKHGKPLMPCKPRKAKVLLKEKKAGVVQKTPFTIQLKYGSSGYKQSITLGVDSGFENIGLSAVTEQRELLSSEVQLRGDIVNSTLNAGSTDGRDVAEKQDTDQPGSPTVAIRAKDGCLRRSSTNSIPT